MRPDLTTAEAAPLTDGSGRPDYDGSAERAPGRRGIGVRARLAALALGIGLLAAACVGTAVGGLLGQRASVHRVSSTFATAATERNAYEGFLTADDQMNMFAALAALRDPAKRPLMSVTWQQVLQGRRQALDALRALERDGDPRLRAMASATLQDFDAYYAYTERMYAAVTAGAVRRAVRLVTVDNAPASNRAQAAFNALGARLSSRVRRIAARADASASSSLTVVVVIALAANVAAILLAAWLVRSITRPLAEATEAAEQIAEGDVEVTLSLDGSDELGRLGRAFRGTIAYMTEMSRAAALIAAGDLTERVQPRSERDALGSAFALMQDRLSDALRGISAGSDSVRSASMEMAQSSQQAGAAAGDIASAVVSVADGAEAQVRALNHVVELTAQVASSSESVAADARQTAEVVGGARASTREGVAAVQRAAEAIHALRDSSHQMSATIRELGSMSEQIGSIVDTIGSIAEQTNLLALNAAIEAARAGEQGRGFAVVAEEVGKLAEESRCAAATIGQLIGQIQVSTTRAVEVVAAGAGQTEEGVQVVERARDAFERIETGVQDLDERVQRIARSVAETFESTGQMRASIEEVLAVAEGSSASAEQVSATTQQSSASAQQVASSAEELARTAASLRDVVARFKLA